MMKNPVIGATLKYWPAGSITQGFGEHIALYQQAIGTNGHNGIDIVAPEGTALVAISDGEVVEVKDDPSGYGKHVRYLSDPDEDGTYYEVTYGHNKENLVKVGDRVEKGQTIATMGNTGFVISGSTVYWGNAPAGKGVHLHFGMRKCSKKKTPWQAAYSSGKKAYICDYDNGLKGAIDPMPFIAGVPSRVTLITSLLRAVSKLLPLLS